MQVGKFIFSSESFDVLPLRRKALLF